MNKQRWLDVTAGAVCMYLVSGLIVTASMMLSVHGNCPWWLPPYWTVTWLGQVVSVIVDLVSA